jgi:endonuclease/exonuclease/phosphatase family metal-dependent hydrolase
MKAVADLRVMSFNLHHGVGADERLDLERSAALVAATAADVVALQEVDSNLGPRSAFVDQPMWLARHLGMDVAFAATIDLPPTARSGPGPRRYGIALLANQPIRGARVVDLPQPAGTEPRRLLVGAVTAGAHTVKVLATHLQHDSAAARLAQAEAIAAEVAASATPVVLLGDLNATPGDPELGPLSGLVDSWAAAGEGAGATFPSDRPRIRIDHVLVSPDLTVSAAAIVPSEASDHLAVVVDLAVGVAG